MFHLHGISWKLHITIAGVFWLIKCLLKLLILSVKNAQNWWKWPKRLCQYFPEDHRYDCNCFRRLLYTPWTTSHSNIMAVNKILQTPPWFLVHSCLFWHFWGDFDIFYIQYQNLVNTWSLLFQKRTQGWFFEFFHFWSFVAFNSRDMTMLWVFNLCSRSSPTKLWRRIFEKMSQKTFLIPEVASQAPNCRIFYMRFMLQSGENDKKANFLS